MRRRSALAHDAQQRIKVVNQHPLVLRLCVVVRARDEGNPRGRPKNIDVALSENLVGSQT